MSLPISNIDEYHPTLSRFFTPTLESYLARLTPENVDSHRSFPHGYYTKKQSFLIQLGRLIHRVQLISNSTLQTAINFNRGNRQHGLECALYEAWDYDHGFYIVLPISWVESECFTKDLDDVTYCLFNIGNFDIWAVKREPKTVKGETVTLQPVQVSDIIREGEWYPAFQPHQFKFRFRHPDSLLLGKVQLRLTMKRIVDQIVHVSSKGSHSTAYNHDIEINGVASNNYQHNNGVVSTKKRFAKIPIYYNGDESSIDFSQSSLSNTQDHSPSDDSKQVKDNAHLGDSPFTQTNNQNSLLSKYQREISRLIPRKPNSQKFLGKVTSMSEIKIKKIPAIRHKTSVTYKSAYRSSLT